MSRHRHPLGVENGYPIGWENDRISCLQRQSRCSSRTEHSAIKTFRGQTAFGESGAYVGSGGGQEIDLQRGGMEPGDGGGRHRAHRGQHPDRAILP